MKFFTQRFTHPFIISAILLRISDKVMMTFCILAKLIHNACIKCESINGISPISAGQLHQSAADRDFHPPLAATSWSAPAPRTGSRAFVVAGPKAWNQLPVHLRALETVGPFKTALKTYLHSFQWLTIPNCLTRRALVMTLFMLYGALEIVGAITITIITTGAGTLAVHSCSFLYFPPCIFSRPI